MNMKKIILLLAFVTLFSCKENERLVYDSNRTDVYFNDVNEYRDSLYVSLLTKENISDAFVNVRILGGMLSVPKKIRVVVIPEKTTAVEGVHYKKLPDYYEFPTDIHTYLMPIVMLKGDESIKEKEVILALRIVETEEVGVAFENQSEIRLVIADMLRTPTGLGILEDMTAFNQLFGEYSKTKHMMIIELVGHDLWDRSPYLYPQTGYFTPYGRKLYKIITEGKYYDENGKLMEGWKMP